MSGRRRSCSIDHFFLLGKSKNEFSEEESNEQKELRDNDTNVEFEQAATPASLCIVHVDRCEDRQSRARFLFIGRVSAFFTFTLEAFFSKRFLAIEVIFSVSNSSKNSASDSKFSIFSFFLLALVTGLNCAKVYF